MRTWLYHPRFPEGKIFDDEGREAPPIPSDPLWVDSPGKLQLTTDDVVKAAVEQELAKQAMDRPQMEAEYKKKFGKRPSTLWSDAAIITALNR
jgi:hypothetical protein